MNGTKGAFCWLGLVLLAASTCGCSPRPVNSPDTEWTDSAGVEIVSGPDIGRSRAPAKLVLPPVLSLGSEEEGPELFGSVSYVELDRDGKLWVADRLAQELRVFLFPSGEHLITMGGPGDGPGEFRAIRPLGFDARGFAHIYDDRLRRLTVFTPDGEIDRQKSILTGEEFSPRPFHVGTRGHLWGQIPRPRIGEVTDGQLLQDTVKIWSIDPEGGDPSLVAAVEGPLFYYRDFRSTPVPFRFGGRFAFHGDQVYFTHPSGEASYLVFSQDGLRRRIGIDRAQAQVSDSDLEAFFEYLEGLGWPEETLRVFDTHLDEMPVPSFKPIWDLPLVSDEGHVWLSRVPGPAQQEVVWDVFDASGAMLGAVEIPKNLIPYQIAAGYVVGVLKDEFDRQTVVVVGFSFSEE